MSIGTKRGLGRALAGMALMVTAACASEPALPMAPPITPEAHAKEVNDWRTKHDVDYRRDWVSIAGLFPFKPGVNTAGSAATNDIKLPESLPPVLGRFVLTGTTVRF